MSNVIKDARAAAKTDEQDVQARRNLVLSYAEMDPIEYDLRAEKFADDMGVRERVLSKQVRLEREKLEKRAEEGEEKARTRIATLPTHNPWSEPVDGVALLDEAHDLVKRFMVMADAQIDLVVLWALHTHMYESFNHSPRLFIDGPMSECGKSVLMNRMIGPMTNKRKAVALMKPAPFFRFAGKGPTFLIDEADLFIKEDLDLLAALHNGWEPGGVVPRCAPDTHEIEEWPTFCPVVMAGIDLVKKLHTATVNRGFTIRLDRASRAEMAGKATYDDAIHQQAFLDVGRKMARFCKDNAAAIKADPAKLPEHVINRQRDRWTPIFKLAQACGPEWEQRALHALATEHSDKDPEAGEELLEAVRKVFDELGVDKISTRTLIKMLCRDEDSRWANWKWRNREQPDKCVDGIIIARLLKTFLIKPTQVWIDGRNLQGYKRADFEKAWASYLDTGPGKIAVHTEKRADRGNLPPRTLEPNAGEALSGNQPPRNTSSLGGDALLKANAGAESRDLGSKTTLSGHIGGNPPESGINGADQVGPELTSEGAEAASSEFNAAEMIYRLRDEHDVNLFIADDDGLDWSGQPPEEVINYLAEYEAEILNELRQQLGRI